MKKQINLVLYKFMPMDGFRKTLETWALKCSTIHGVNDVLENIPRVSTDGKLDINTCSRHLFTEAFFSFSHRMSIPAMWGHYAANATGVCMIFVFPCEALTGEEEYCVLKDARSYDCAGENASTEKKLLSNLKYCNERAKAPNDGIDKYPINERGTEIAKRYFELLIRKAECWEYEKEIRLFDSFDAADKAAGDFLLYSWCMKYFAGVILAPHCHIPCKVMRRLIDLSYDQVKKAQPSFILPLLKDGWVITNAEFSPTQFSICAEGVKDNMTYMEFKKEFM